MKRWLAVAVIFGASLGTLAQVKPCEDLKAEIAKKLDAKGVVNYTLTVVDKGKEADGKVVGSCDGGTKSIVYVRGKAEPKAAAEKKP